MKANKGITVLVVSMVAGSLVLAGCGKKNPSLYTNRSWTEALGDDWSPFTWETNAENSMLDYLTEPLIGTAPLDTEKLSWQWTYRAAKSVEDVTEDHVEDLEKYGVDYDEDDLEGYVYEIKINPNVKFEEKEVTINGKTNKYGGYTVKAQDYVESAKLMLSSEYRNYRANNYYSGDSAIAGAKNYYDSGYVGLVPSTDAYDDYSDEIASNLYFFGSKDNADGSSYLVDWFTTTYSSYASYVTNYGPGAIYWLFGYTEELEDSVATFESLDGKTVAEINADPTLAATLKDLVEFWLEPDPYDSLYNLIFCYSSYAYPEYDWEDVGLYAEDDETLIYVVQGQTDIDNFKTSLTSNWLVENNLFKALSYDDATTGLKVSTYNSSAETTISYGPYKLTNFEEDKQVKYEQNENWYGWTGKDGDRFTATSESLGYKVNGSYQTIYQTSSVVIDVMAQNTAKQKFEKGELNDYTPTASELINEYSNSSQLYQVDETYTMRFFLDTNLEDLRKMDETGTNTNGVALSNINFRKAFSLAINRADWVKSTEGYKPAYSLINSLYYYDVFNDPESIYRNTPQAMTAIVNLYGVEYGEGKQYATLEEAYKSVTGYNLDEAKELMKTACDELVAAGLYTKGQEVKFSVAYKKGALEASDNTQVSKIEEYLNAAVEGSGFGKITLTPVGNLADRYGAVGTEGTYAIGYGAWGGAVFYPFTMFRVYMDPSYADLHSGRCWSPDKEALTLTVGGEEVTMTWQNWSKFAATGGKYVNADNETKLDILAALEERYLGRLYDIPLATSTSCFLLGYQQDYFTDEYNIMYGFGGLELLKYNYDDAAWEAYVNSQGGQLNYK